MIIQLYLIIYLPVIFWGYSGKNEYVSLSKEQMMEIVLFHSNQHIQSKTEQLLLKKYNIKSAYYVKEYFEEPKIDTTTYIEYDSEGRIIRKTTSECTTIGCVPFKIRQEFKYSGKKIMRMGVYTFGYKYKFMLDYCLIKNTNKLSLFNWENYSYISDTTIVKSSLFIYKYVTAPNGRLIHYYLNNNSHNKQMDLSTGVSYEYSDSTIISKLSNGSFQDSQYEQYKIKNEHTIILEYNNALPVEASIIEFNFNHKGLLSEITTYKKEVMITRTTLCYLE